MDLISVTHENLDREHICCAISNNVDIQVASKKAWLADRLDEGLVFLKGDVRGKCFIEYIPAECAWTPIDAEGYMFINCLWVSGQFKGHGYSNLLMDECVRDSAAKGKKGLAILTSQKKRGFLADKKYLEHKGFKLADEKPPYFQIMYLPFADNAPAPRFRRVAPPAAGHGFTVYYTNQCPYTAKYVPILENMARDAGAPIEVFHITAKQQAQSAPVPFTTFALFEDGEFVTHEILSEKKFGVLIAKREA